MLIVRRLTERTGSRLGVYVYRSRVHTSIAIDDFAVLRFVLFVFQSCNTCVLWFEISLIQKRVVAMVKVRFGLMLVAVVAAMFGSFAGESKAQNAWGGMQASGAAVAQALSTTAARLTAFTAALPSSSTDGDLSITTTIASDTMTLVPGTYLIRYSYSGTADATTLVTFTLRNGTTAITGASARVNHPASTSVTANIDTLFSPTATATLNVFAVAASGTPSITATDAQLVVVRLK